MVIRKFEWDEPKALSRIKREINLVCAIPGCGQALTTFLGPGSDSVCREHQINLSVYGGLGYHGRDYTHHRKWNCDWCGWDPRTDPRFDRIEDLGTKLSAQRACLIGDHKERRADGGLDTEDNIQTLCNTCNNIKTMMNGDTIAASKKSSKIPK